MHCVVALSTVPHLHGLCIWWHLDGSLHAALLLWTSTLILTTNQPHKSTQKQHISHRNHVVRVPLMMRLELED